jgi:hypothetical protein
MSLALLIISLAGYFVRMATDVGYLKWGMAWFISFLAD